MAKGRVQKEAKNAKSHLKSRIDFLQQAADYFRDCQQPENSRGQTRDGEFSTSSTRTDLERRSLSIDAATGTRTARIGQPGDKDHLLNLSRVYVSQMRGVSLKTQTRLSIPVKRSFCKRCDTLLIAGSTCQSEVRNDSRGRKKPWADVLVMQCLVCGTEKHVPQNSTRSEKLSDRRKARTREARENPSDKT